jgi:hypothetical protein
MSENLRMAEYWVKKYWREATLVVLFAVPLFSPAFFSLIQQLGHGQALMIRFWVNF